MKVKYESIWNKGKLEIETDDIKELINSLRQLEEENPSFETPISTTPEGMVSKQREMEYTGSIPEITATGITEGIEKLLRTEWGRQPRKISEIMKAFEENGIIFDKDSVGVTLRRLFKLGRIKRKKVEGRWGYFIDTTILQRQ
jgi:hypothetical protein